MGEGRCGVVIRTSWLLCLLFFPSFSAVHALHFGLPKNHLILRASAKQYYHNRPGVPILTVYHVTLIKHGLAEGCVCGIFEKPVVRNRMSHQLPGFTVRFFLADEGPFFFARVTLIGSGVLARVSSSGTSYCWNDGNVGGGVDIRSNKLGVCCRETGTGGSRTTPSGISPSFSTTKCGGADREASLRSANKRSSSKKRAHVNSVMDRKGFMDQSITFGQWRR